MTTPQKCLCGFYTARVVFYRRGLWLEAFLFQLLHGGPNNAMGMAVNRVLHAEEASIPKWPFGRIALPILTQPGVVVSHSTPRCVLLICVSELYPYGSPTLILTPAAQLIPSFDREMTPLNRPHLL